MRNNLSGHSLFRSAGSIFAIKVFPALAALGVMLFYARVLPQAAYGRYQNVWIRLAIMGTFAYAGIPAFLLSYTAAEVRSLALNSSRRLKGGLLGWLLLWAAAYAWLQESRDGIAWLPSLLLLLLYVANAVQESLIIVAGRSRSIIAATLLYTLGYAWLHYHLYDQPTGVLHLEALLWGLVLLGAVRLLYYTIVVYGAYRRPGGDLATQPVAAGVFHYWGHAGLYDLLQTIFRWADKFIISLFLSESISAVYFNGSQDIPFVSLLLGAFSSSVLVATAGKDTSDQLAVQLMRYSGRLLSCLIFPLFWFLLLYRYELFGLAFGAGYRASVPVFAVSILLLPLRAYGFGTLLQRKKQGRLINTGAILDLGIAFALMYPLYRWLGLPGVALSFVLSTIVQCLYYLWQTGHLYQSGIAAMLPLGNWAAKLIVFGVLFIAMYYATQGIDDAYIRLSLGGVLALVLALVSLLAAIKRPGYTDVKDRTQGHIQEH